MELEGNDFSYEEIKKWYEEEANYHNQFKGVRNKNYWSIYELFNRKYAINKWVRLNPDTRVLSFGCADGSDTKRIHERYNFKLFGLEISDKLIKSYKEKNPNGVIKKATIAGQINYPNNFFHYIFVFGVLHHIPNVSFVLKELIRVLKLKGIMII